MYKGSGHVLEALIAALSLFVNCRKVEDGSNRSSTGGEEVVSGNSKATTRRKS